MIEIIKRWLKVIIAGALAVMLVSLFFRIDAARRKAERERDELASIVLLQEDTIEIKDGLYQKKVVELNNVSTLLDNEKAWTRFLRENIDEQGRELVSYTELALSWKRKYEALLEATQTEEPPTDPGGPARTRVSFGKDFGPFKVGGYTITNPPEAFVSVEQTRPLKIGVALTQGKDGKWSSLVTTDDKENYKVDVSLSAVDRHFEKIDWRDKLTLGLDVGLFGTPSVGVGVIYGDDTAYGARCSVYAGSGAGYSCGLSLSWRPFDR